MTVVWLVTVSPPGVESMEWFDPGKWHAIDVGETKDPKMSDAQGLRAACGLRPRRGWQIDLFLDDDERCRRCEKALGLDPSPINQQREYWRLRAKARRLGS